jgi:hypothetical protein
MEFSAENHFPWEKMYKKLAPDELDPNCCLISTVEGKDWA